MDDAGTLIIVGDVKKNLVEVLHERLSRVMDETRRQTLLELVEEVSEDSEMEAVLQLLSKEAGTFVSLEEEKKRVQEHLKSLEESHWESLYQSIEKNYLEKKQIEKKKKEQEQIEQEQIEQEQIEKSSRSYELDREGYSKETVESKVVDDAGAIVTVGGAKQNLVEVFHERLSRVMDKTRRQTLLELVEEVSVLRNSLHGPVFSYINQINSPHL